MKTAFYGALALLMLHANQTKAQNSKKFYIDINSGYSIPLISQPAGITEYNYHRGSGSFTTLASVKWETNYSRFGSGRNFGGFVGYKIADFLAIELSVSHIKTNPFIDNGLIVYFSGVVTRKEETTLESSMLNICPGFRLFKSMNKNEVFYRMSPTFGITKITERILAYSNGYPSGLMLVNSTYESTRELSGGLSYGFFMSTGYKRLIYNNLGLSIELFTNIQNYVPRKYTVTKLIQNGNDLLPDISVYIKENEYVDELTLLAHDEPNKEEPSRIVRTRTNSYLFNSVGIQIGINYQF